MSDALVIVHYETDVDNCIDPIWATRIGVIVGCNIDFSYLRVSITQRPSILKSDDCHWPAAPATGSVLFVSIKRKVFS